MKRIIGIISGKGGVGKTTLAINLSAAFHEFQVENVLVDANLSNANLSLQLGMQYTPITLQDVLNGEINVFHAIRIHPTGLRVIPTSISLNKLNADISRLSSVLAQLNSTVIVDFPPGINDEFKEILKACDEALVITNPEIPAVTDALKAIRIAHKLKKPIIGIALNRVRNEPFELSVREVEHLCEIPVIGVIPEDKKVREANSESLPVVFRNPYSKSAIAFKKLASAILGKAWEPPRFLRLRQILGRA